MSSRGFSIYDKSLHLIPGDNSLNDNLLLLLLFTKLNDYLERDDGVPVALEGPAVLLRVVTILQQGCQLVHYWEKMREKMGEMFLTN